MMQEGKSLAVVCLSLGGTKLQVGALTRTGTFISAPEVLWRSEPSFQACLTDNDPRAFCSLLSQQIAHFLERHRFGLEDVQVFGLPFPGPKEGDRWYSNNLTPAFRRGVALEEEMRTALSLAGPCRFRPVVRVIFDAQCDAGGELYHPQGRLYGEQEPTATVLNIATGIAAGYIAHGRVLVEERDFRDQIASTYDAGAGQLGRHLWYLPHSGQWQYHYCKGGGTPQVAGIRLTERLSGPALAGRLLHRLGHADLLHPPIWQTEVVPFSAMMDLFRQIEKADIVVDGAAIAQRLRAASTPIATALLCWADARLASEPTGEPACDAVAACLREFATEVTTELAGALRAWMTSPGWARYGRCIVLTGGVGIHFLASTDRAPPQGLSFLRLLTSALPEGCRVERSLLSHAMERECYLFRQQLT